MKIIGKSIGTLFPQSEISVDICDHRHGAVATISQETDTLKSTSRYAAELFGFKHNIGLSAFISSIYDDSVDKLDCEQSGRIRFDIYFVGLYWKNPNTNVIEPIPDYNSATWTASGVTAFSGAVLGASKSISFPKHGQDMYDISSGDFGYDFTTETNGTSNLSELYGMVDDEINFFNTLLDRRMSSISYSIGDDAAKNLLITKFLTGRNSGYSITGDSVTEYGQSKNSPNDFLGLPAQIIERLDFLSKPSSTRWYDTWHSLGLTETQANDYCEAEILKTIANGGFYNDFIHWHNTLTDGDLQALERWFNLINTTIATNFVHRCGYGEANEYLFFREMISRVSAFEQSNKVYIVLQKKDEFKGTYINGILNDLPIDSINTPISVKIDLTGTYLAAKNIKSNTVGIRSLGSDQYIIDIAFSNSKEGYVSAVLEEETGATNYYDFTLPSISSATVSSQVLTVVSNVPTKCVVFIAERGAAIETALLLERSNTLGTSHGIVLTTTNQAKDIYIGLITKEKQSILSTVYRFV